MRSHGHHCCIIGTIGKGGDGNFPALFFAAFKEHFAEMGIGCHSSSKAYAFDAGFIHGFFEPFQEVGNNSVLVGGTYICQVFFHKGWVFLRFFLDKV